MAINIRRLLIIQTINFLTMNKKLIILFTFSISFINCSTVRSQLKSDGNQDVAIQNAIIDFEKTRLYKDGIVFKVNKKNLDENLIFVEIIEGEENKYLYSMSKPITDNILPSRYFEKNGKLFIWWDDQYKINQEMFDVLKKYNMLKDDEGGWISILDPISDDNKKGAEYFFCKNDLTIYKRFITNVGRTPTPNLKCK